MAAPPRYRYGLMESRIYHYPKSAYDLSKTALMAVLVIAGSVIAVAVVLDAADVIGRWI